MVPDCQFWKLAIVLKFSAVMDEAIALFKELLEIPSVIRLFFGWRCKFAILHGSLNLLEKKAAYLLTALGPVKLTKKQKVLENSRSRFFQRCQFQLYPPKLCYPDRRRLFSYYNQQYNFRN
jgi:hypothetical protein